MPRVRAHDLLTIMNDSACYTLRDPPIRRNVLALWPARSTHGVLDGAGCEECAIDCRKTSRRHPIHGGLGRRSSTGLPCALEEDSIA